MVISVFCIAKNLDKILNFPLDTKDTKMTYAVWFSLNESDYVKVKDVYNIEMTEAMLVFRDKEGKLLACFRSWFKCLYEG